MNTRHPYGVLHSFSNKNIFNNKMELRLFYFHATIVLRILPAVGPSIQSYALSLCDNKKFLLI